MTQGGLPSTRTAPRGEAKHLKPGADHYASFVGPPRQWDFMAATQFRLLTALGLREHHRVLDLGCGSLRAGRLLIPYLDPDGYFGIEPEEWLVKEGLSREVGADLVVLKRPRFLHGRDFPADGFGVAFDFILAQSVFSHAGPDLIGPALARCRAALAPHGLMLATFIHPERLPDAPRAAPGWTYPGCTTHEAAAIDGLIGAAGLCGRALPWWHPRQTWYAIAASPDDLPPAAQDMHLTGGTLRDPEFAASLEVRP